MNKQATNTTAPMAKQIVVFPMRVLNKFNMQSFNFLKQFIENIPYPKLEFFLL